jgi:hypothetical protein
LGSLWPAVPLHPQRLCNQCGKPTTNSCVGGKYRQAQHRVLSKAYKDATFCLGAVELPLQLGSLWLAMPLHPQRLCNQGGKPTMNSCVGGKYRQAWHRALSKAYRDAKFCLGAAELPLQLGSLWPALPLHPQRLCNYCGKPTRNSCVGGWYRQARHRALSKAYPDAKVLPRSGRVTPTIGPKHC